MGNSGEYGDDAREYQSEKGDSAVGQANENPSTTLEIEQEKEEELLTGLKENNHE